MNPIPQPAGPGDAPPAASRSHASIMHAFDRFAGHATRWAGSPVAFALAVVVVAAWALTGPLFAYSETWQLVINTGTTIITFLMVFLIQQSQNKDALAVHLKLNELLASHRQASNRLVCIEDLDEEELKRLLAFYRHLSTLAEADSDIKAGHSIDEARENQAEKAQVRRQAQAADK